VEVPSIFGQTSGCHLVLHAWWPHGEEIVYSHEEIVIFKIFTKVGTNRVTEVAHAMVRPTQTVFMPECQILEGVVVLHETIHELHRRKLDGVLLKIDFEKAYDKVK
jgi:hypothetical protein